MLIKYSDLGVEVETVIPYGNSNSIEEFIKENRYKGLKHLVIDDNPTRPDFIKNILKDEEKFSYLEKIFDSKENDYKYDFRIFQIDFKEFDRINP